MIQTYGGSFTNDWTAYQGFRDAFSEVMDPRFYNIEWLDRKVWNCDFRFWSNQTSAIITEVKTFPAGAMEIAGVLAAGELSDIKELIKEAEQWGAKIGCITAEIASRPGWKAKLKADGYEEYQLCLKKDLC